MVLKYAENETSKLNEIKSLLRAWKKEVSRSEITLRNKTVFLGKDLYTEDGFLPNYYNQKYKVLFIGREDTRGIDLGKKGSMVNNLLKIFKDIPLDNRYGLLGPLLTLLYGIENIGEIKYKNIPAPANIASEIGKPNGLSFSMMDLSKYVNQDNGYKSDKNLILKFLKDSNLEKTKFYKEEFSILNPDIIITLRLWKLNNKISEYINNFVFPNLKFIQRFGKKGQWNTVTLNYIILNRKRIPVIDMGHFSKPGRNVEKDLYNPLMKVLKSKSFKEIFPRF
jgi:hypothetical protein